MSRISFYALSALLFFTCIQFTYGADDTDDGEDISLDFDLRPLRLRDLLTDPSPPSNELSLLDPVDEEFHLWGNPPPDGSPFYIANMTVFAAENERFLSLDRFDHLLNNLECGERIALTFKNKDAFQYARKSWDWLGKSKGRNFTVVTDNPACAEKDVRRVYSVTKIDFDPKNLVAFFYGKPTQWKDTLHDMDLQFSYGKVLSKLEKRIDWSGDLDFPIPAININGVMHENDLITIKCIDCGVRGRFLLVARFRLEGFSIAEASLEFKPDGVRAGMSIEVETRLGEGVSQGPLDIAFTKSLGRKEMAFPRLRIAGLIKVNTAWNFEWLIAATGFESGRGMMTYGAGYGFSNDARIYVNLIGEEENDFSGWGLVFDQDRCKASGNVKGTVTTALTLVPAIEFEFLGLQFEIGLMLRPFEAMLSVDGLGTEGTICDKEGVNGTSVNLQLAAAINMRAGPFGDTGWAATYPLLVEPIWQVDLKRGLDGPAAMSALEPRQDRPKKPGDSNPDQDPRVPQHENPLTGSFAVYFSILKFVKTLCERCIPPDEPPPRPQSPEPPRPLRDAIDLTECYEHNTIGWCRHRRAICRRGRKMSPTEPRDTGPPCHGDAVACCVPRVPEFRDPVGEICRAGVNIGVCQDPDFWDCTEGEYETDPYWVWYLGRELCPGKKQCCVSDRPPFNWFIHESPDEDDDGWGPEPDWVRYPCVRGRLV